MGSQNGALCYYINREWMGGLKTKITKENWYSLARDNISQYCMALDMWCHDLLIGCSIHLIEGPAYTGPWL